MWMHGDVGWGWMAVGWIWMFLFWGTLIGLAVWGISRITGVRSTSIATPVDIARVRYARGEITKEEFESLKHDLA